jgi:5-formyltetrahydrofolate cyclo-ligase
VRLDLIVTPDRVIGCRSRGRRTASIRWDELTHEKVAAIPVLRRLRTEGR